MYIDDEGMLVLGRERLKLTGPDRIGLLSAEAASKKSNHLYQSVADVSALEGVQVTMYRVTCRSTLMGQRESPKGSTGIRSSNWVAIRDFSLVFISRLIDGTRALISCTLLNDCVSRLK